MRLWERIPGKRRNMEKRSKQAFQSVLETAEMLLLGAKTFVEKVTVFDYLIWVLGQQIAADGQTACSKCADHRFAAMFRLAQMKWEAGMPVGLTAELQEKRRSLRSEAEERMSVPNEEMFLKVVRSYEDRLQELRLKLDCAEKENECLKKRLEQNDRCVP